MSIAVGSAASREEMAAAQRTGSHLAEEFLKSSAKEMLITAKVSTENSILQERSRRELQAWMVCKYGFIHVRGFGQISWLRNGCYYNSNSHKGGLTWDFCLSIRLPMCYFLYSFICMFVICIQVHVLQCCLSSFFCERAQHRINVWWKPSAES